MNFGSMTIEEYSKELGSRASAPGGGAALALTVSQGMNLLAMVCYLTLGNERYAAYEPQVTALLPRIRELEISTLELMDRDAEAFAMVAEVYQVPKEDPSRSERMESALHVCCQVPLQLMTDSLEGLRICDQLLGRSNPNVVSDLGVAALFFRSGIEGSWLNVKANLFGIKEEIYQKYAKETGEKIFAEGVDLANELYQVTLGELK